MIIDDYHKIIAEVVEINTDTTSIADSRRLITEINDKETMLLKLKENVIKDIRTRESNFLKEKSALRNKYSMKQTNGITGMIMGSPKNKLIKELKRLEFKTKHDIEELKDIKYVIDDLLVQFDDIKIPLNRSMRERFGN